MFIALFSPEQELLVLEQPNGQMIISCESVEKTFMDFDFKYCENLRLCEI